MYRTFAWGGSEHVELEPSVKNNRAVHPEVNLNIAELFADRRGEAIDLAPVLEACVSKEGTVKSYFYPSDYYGAYWLVAASSKGAAVPAQTVRNVVEFVVGTQESTGAWAEGDPYATALAAATLRRANRHEDRRRLAVRFLEETQRTDGSWSTMSDVWRYTHEPGVVWNARDSNRVVTTALAVEAMG